MELGVERFYVFFILMSVLQRFKTFLPSHVSSVFKRFFLIFPPNVLTSMKESLNAQNQLDLSSRFDRTRTCDRYTDTDRQYRAVT